MKNFRFLWLLAVLTVFTVSCNKKDNGGDDNRDDENVPGHVELHLNQAKVYDKDAEVAYSSVINGAVINSQVSNPEIQGELVNVPSVGQTKDVEPDPDNVNNSGGCYVGFWGNFSSPDGRTVNVLEAQTGVVSRPANDRLEAQGTCLCVVNQMDTVTYNFRLSVKINKFD